MEEVWKDISLSSLHQYNNTNNSSLNHRTNFHFQDLFSDPKLLNIDPPLVLTPNDASFGDHASHTSTTTTLSLGNGISSSSSSVDHQISKRKSARCNDHGETCDQRRTRLMKCRESADRSRARKQAYIKQMEQDLAKLRKENARLKNQVTQFYLATTPVEVPKKSTLCRTLTAPF